MKLQYIIILLFITACTSDIKSNNVEYNFSKLNLEHKSTEGKKLWKINSPKAIYSISSRLIRASKPLGLIYKDNSPIFNIEAKHASIINEGKIIVLEGKVVLRRFIETRSIIRGERLRWTPEESLLIIEKKKNNRYKSYIIKTNL